MWYQQRLLHRIRVGDRRTGNISPERKRLHLQLRNTDHRGRFPCRVHQHRLLRSLQPGPSLPEYEDHRHGSDALHAHPPGVWSRLLKLRHRRQPHPSSVGAVSAVVGLQEDPVPRWLELLRRTGYISHFPRRGQARQPGCICRERRLVCDRA
ncbi:hypothetical protein BJX76DRAFT_157746 [Aspergillus varians]